MQDSLRGAERKFPRSVRRIKSIVGEIRVSRTARLVATRVACDAAQRLVGVGVARVIEGARTDAAVNAIMIALSSRG